MLGQNDEIWFTGTILVCPSNLSEYTRYTHASSSLSHIHVHVYQLHTNMHLYVPHLNTEIQARVHSIKDSEAWRCKHTGTQADASSYYAFTQQLFEFPWAAPRSKKQ